MAGTRLGPVGAYARYNYEKWVRKNEFEKTADFDARTSHKVKRVREFQNEDRDLMQGLRGHVGLG